MTGNLPWPPASRHSPRFDRYSDLARLYRMGLTLREMYRVTGIPRESIRVRLEEEGLILRHHGVLYHPPRTELDPEASSLLGLHAGDGWLSQEWGLALNRRDVLMKQSAMRLVRDVLGVEPFISKKADQSITIRSGQPQVKQFFLGYGFVMGKKARTVEVPAAILESRNLEIVKSFLKGLFSADGYFGYSGRSARCSLSVSSPALRDGFVELSSSLGFTFQKYTNVHRGGRNKVPLNVANLGRRSEVIRWMGEVGSFCDSHLKRFEKWKRVIG